MLTEKQIRDEIIPKALKACGGLATVTELAEAAKKFVKAEELTTSENQSESVLERRIRNVISHQERFTIKFYNGYWVDKTVLPASIFM